MINELIVKNRSYRSFTSKEITQDELTQMMECGRLGASTKNSQAVKYALITDTDLCRDIFPYTAWAGAIEWNPTIDVAPVAYIAMCGDPDLMVTKEYLYFDMGVSAQNILLKASEMGYGGCILGAFNKVKIKELLGLEDRYDISILIALGEPNERVVLTEAVDGDTTYYRDEDNVHYVPKRPLEELIILKK